MPDERVQAWLDNVETGREDQFVIARTADGQEEMQPALQGGEGINYRYPPPGTDAWKSIVQDGLNLAAAADPPNESSTMELQLYKRIAYEELPLDCLAWDRQGYPYIDEKLAQKKEPPVEIEIPNITPEVKEVIEQQLVEPGLPPVSGAIELGQSLIDIKANITAVSILLDNGMPLESIAPLIHQLKADIDKL